MGTKNEKVGATKRGQIRGKESFCKEANLHLGNEVWGQQGKSILHLKHSYFETMKSSPSREVTSDLPYETTKGMKKGIFL